LPCPLGLDTDLSLGDLRFLALPPLRLPKVTLLELLTAFATFLFSFSHYLPFILSTIDHTAPTTVNAPPITAVTIPSSKRPLATTIPPTKVSTCLTIPKIVSLFIVLGFYYLQDFFFDCAGFDILTITDFPLGVDVFFTATFMSFDLPYFIVFKFCISKLAINYYFTITAVIIFYTHFFA
jgi:hypothetical protein